MANADRNSKDSVLRELNDRPSCTVETEPEAPRKKMMSAETVAQALVSVLILPEDSTVEELTIMPAAGTL